MNGFAEFGIVQLPVGCGYNLGQVAIYVISALDALMAKKMGEYKASVDKLMEIEENAHDYHERGIFIAWKELVLYHAVIRDCAAAIIGRKGDWGPWISYAGLNDEAKPIPVVSVDKCKEWMQVHGTIVFNFFHYVVELVRIESAELLQKYGCLA